MVSRCRCCRDFQEESLAHLFIHLETARDVWRCFGQIFRLPYVFTSIHQAVKTSGAIPSSPSQFDIFRMATAAHVLHEIWIARCRATYDDKLMHTTHICIHTIRKIQLISLVHLPQRPSTKLQYHQLKIMGVSGKHVRFKKEGWFR